MKLPSRKILLVGAAVGVVVLVGAVAAVIEAWAVAVIALLILQVAALGVAWEAIRRGGRQVAALERLSRDVTNVSARVVTEARAIQADIAAQRDAPGAAGSDRDEPPVG